MRKGAAKADEGGFGWTATCMGVCQSSQSGLGRAHEAGSNGSGCMSRCGSKRRSKRGGGPQSE